MAEAGPRSGRLLAFALLLALPLALRLPAVDHGLPRNYVPDTHVVRQALGMAKDKDPFPPSGRYSTYPNAIPYMLLPIYAAEYVLGRATGAWGGSEEFKMRALEDPAVVHLPARLLVALLGALTPYLIFRTARAAGYGRGAWVAAWLVATGLLHTQFSVQERPWVPLTFFGAASLWPAVLYAREGRAKHLAYSGLAAGLAGACHQAGIGFLGVAGLAWLVGPLGWRPADLRRRLFQGVGAVGLALAVMLLVGFPQLLVHGPTPEEAVSGFSEEAGFAEQMDQAPGFEIGGQRIHFLFRPETFTRLAKALFGYDPALVLLALLGLWAALVKRETRAVTLFACLWAAFFLTHHNDHVRYLLPLCVLGAIPAAAAAELLWPMGRAKPGAGGIALVLLLALPLVQGLRFVHLLRAGDTRAEAEAVLASLPPGAVVAIDRYGPQVPLSGAALERLSTWRELRMREGHRALYFEAGVDPPDGPGVDAFFVEDLLVFDDRERRMALRTLPVELPAEDLGSLLGAVGATHLLTVDRRPSDGPSLLLDPEVNARGMDALDAGWVEAAEIRPAAGGVPAECFLPTEMDFPLTGLWRVDRAGPRLRLFLRSG